MSHACPSCGKQAMSELRKSWLGPAMTAKCDACGAGITVPARSIVAVLPSLGAVIAGSFIPGWAATAALWAVAVALMFFIHSRMPLVRR